MQRAWERCRGWQREKGGGSRRRELGVSKKRGQVEERRQSSAAAGEEKRKGCAPDRRAVVQKALSRYKDSTAEILAVPFID
eukprot:3498892-Rhodomonas_salina.2